MNRQIAVIVAFLMLLNIFSSKACSCGPPPPDFLTDLRQVFSYYQLPGFSTDAFVVVKGVVTGLTPNQHGVLFKPLRNYFGRIPKDTIIIWGTDGVDCRLGIVGFYKLPADTFIFLMNRNTSKEYPYEDTADFHITACGNRYLTIKNDSVFGGYPGTFAWDGFPLSSFEDDSLNFWIHALKVESSMPFSFEALLYPNPVTAGEGLHLRGLFNENFNIAICDVAGKVIKLYSERSQNATEGNIPISLIDLQGGEYLLQIVSATRRQTLRFTLISP